MKGRGTIGHRLWIPAVVLISLLSLAATLVVAFVQAPATLLDRIVARGYILVGTCGDYKPFTYLNPDTKEFSGIDIDMANELGKALGVETRFIKTTWPTLMNDFHEGRFDIGMGGISVNLGRQKTGFFSIPYLTGGKTPITRKENVDKFQTLEQIDQPGVRVIVNPGGTNERFVRAHIRKAEIIAYNDNVTIFDQIVQGKADLMITDAVETLLQQKLHPQLAAVHPDKPFTYSEKGYLMPRDVVLKAFVDQWLHLTLMGGNFQKIYDNWLK